MLATLSLTNQINISITDPYNIPQSKGRKMCWWLPSPSSSLLFYVRVETRSLFNWKIDSIIMCHCTFSCTSCFLIIKTTKATPQFPCNDLLCSRLPERHIRCAANISTLYQVHYHLMVCLTNSHNTNVYNHLILRYECMNRKTQRPPLCREAARLSPAEFSLPTIILHYWGK